MTTSFVHRNTTRRLLSLAIGMVVGPIGAALVYAFVLFDLREGLRGGMWVGLVVGVMWLLLGSVFVYRYVRPLDRESTITRERIVCAVNGLSKHDFAREDIDTVELSLGSIELIRVLLNDGKRRRIEPVFFVNFEKLRDHLVACGYPVVES